MLAPDEQRLPHYSFALAPERKAERPADHGMVPIRDRTGIVLVHSHITDFDGADSTVEHAGGIARIPYDSVPLAYRLSCRKS